MSTTGSTIDIVSTDITALNALLNNGPIFALFEDGTNQYIKITSGVVSGGVGVVSGIIGANLDGTFGTPVNHLSGTVLTAQYVSGGTYYTIGPVSIVTPTTPKVPAYDPPDNLFLDSVAHWTSPVSGVPEVSRKWSAARGVTSTAPWGRTGIQVTNGLGPTLILPRSLSVITVGTRYQTQALANSIIEFIGPFEFNYTVGLVHSTAGAVKVVFGPASSSDITVPLVTNTEYYIELQGSLSAALKMTYRVRIWNSSGTKIKDVNGTLSSSISTTNKWIGFGLGGPGGGNSAWVGDIYCTTSNFLGNSVVSYLRAAGVGDISQGAVSTGPGPLWFNNSDGQLPDDNTTTTEYSAQNKRDLYTLDSIADPGGGKQPVAWQGIALQEHPGTNTSTGMIAIKTNSKEVDNTTVLSCYNQYNYGRWPALLNPVTGKIFTWAEVNLLQSGPMRNK